ncbi:MAG: DUF2971 domain-containing protein [Christensenella sp.]|nr:DUF2971 domain-containing protein [Christensenella sp.]
MIKTYLAVIQEECFRSYLEKRSPGIIPQATCIGTRDCFPPLYRYRNFSDYVVNDITCQKLSLSLISTFNDLYDCTIHLPCQKGNIVADFEALVPSLPTSNAAFISYYKDQYINGQTLRAEKKERLNFDLLSYLKTYACCFSTDNQSLLMWSHYSNCSQGICVEYNFNELAETSFISKTIFPVVYTASPLELNDLMNSESIADCLYPLDAACLLAALNKCNDWQYEKEWRIIYRDDEKNLATDYISIDSYILPKRILFGYHFLKNFFVADDSCEQQIENVKKLLDNLDVLVSFMLQSGILAAYIIPTIGKFELNVVDFPIQILEDFSKEHLEKNDIPNIKFYNHLHTIFKELIEKTIM